MSVSFRLDVDGAQVECEAERDGPFWRVSSPAYPEATASAADLTQARARMRERLQALTRR